MKNFNYYFTFFFLILIPKLLIAQNSYDFAWINQTQNTSPPFIVNDCAQSITLTVNNGTFSPMQNPSLLSTGSGSVVLDWGDNAQMKTVTITFGAVVSNPAIRIGDLDREAGNTPSEFFDQFSALPSAVSPPLQLVNGNTAIHPTGDNQDGWIYWTGNYTAISFTYNRPKRDYGLFLDSIVYSCACCDGENLVTNGDFENRISGFTSTYVNNPQLLPGQYSVTDHSGAAAACSQWDINGAAACSTTDNFLLVNGLTNQPTGSTSTIWSQTIQDIKGGKYELCLDIKNLPSCCFDVNPVLIITVGGNQFTHIIQAGNTSCDWQNLSIPYNLMDAGSIPISIAIQEDGVGDGNDFAIDNIHFSRLQELDLYTSNLPIGTDPPTVTSSIWNITAADDNLDSSCDFRWEITSSTGTTSNPNWGLTTSFLGYTFERKKTYTVELIVEHCDCFQDDAFAHNFEIDPKGVIKFYPTDKYFKKKITGKSEIILHPNPASNIVNINFLNKTLNNPAVVTIFGIDGNIILTKKMSNNQVNISTIPKGIYNINIVTEKLNITKKLIVQ